MDTKKEATRGWKVSELWGLLREDQKPLALRLVGAFASGNSVDSQALIELMRSVDSKQMRALRRLVGPRDNAMFVIFHRAVLDINLVVQKYKKKDARKDAKGDDKRKKKVARSKKRL